MIRGHRIDGKETVDVRNGRRDNHTHIYGATTDPRRLDPFKPSALPESRALISIAAVVAVAGNARFLLIERRRTVNG